MSTVTELQNGHGQDLLFWVKITGSPFYFMCVYSPSNALKFGSFAWSLPAGYSAKGGMMLPNQQLAQTLPDLIGGIASAERMQITLTDFDLYDAAGEYQYLARLFSPGIATSTAGGYMELASDIPASFTTGSVVSFRSGTVTPSSGFYTVGSETIEFNSFTAPVNGICTGTITGGRNRFPCSSVYPPIPYHRVVRRETDGAAVGRNILVTPYATPIGMIGRTIAFYIGTMAANGMPLPESDGMLRLVGKITSYNDNGDGTWTISMSSVMNELSGALAAPGLGVARIKDDQIILPSQTHAAGSDFNWLVFYSETGTPDGQVWWSSTITISAAGITGNIFTLRQLFERINAAFVAFDIGVSTSDGGPWLDWVDVDGQMHAVFYELNHPDTPTRRTISSAPHGILTALGWDTAPGGRTKVVIDESVAIVSTPSGPRAQYRAVAPRPVPNVFIPVTTVNASDPVTFGVEGQDGSVSQHFFTDQGDGRAFVQFGDGAIVYLVAQATDSRGLLLRTGERWRRAQGLTLPSTATIADSPPYYRVSVGEKATVKQVVVAGDRSTEVDAGLLVGRFMASHDEASALGDLNYYPEGVGLGLNQLMSADSFLAIASYGPSFPREAIVDNSTKLTDLLLPILKEYGLAIVWDPETSRIVARALRIPAAPSAHAIALSDSNRTAPGDRTTSEGSTAHVVTSWRLKWGWDATEKKFLGSEMHLIDNVVQSMGTDTKDVTIEDKTLVSNSDLDAVELLDSCVFSRSHLYRDKWDECTRTLNRFGLTLAPGSYHLIGPDQSLRNPFTGLRGVTAANAIYGLLLSVTSNPAQPDGGRCEFLIDRQSPSSFIRKLSPVGLIDYSAPARGYDTATGIVTMDRRYSSHATYDDGYDFVVGDDVAMVARDGWAVINSGLIVSAVAADGSTITVPSGGTAIPADTEALIVLMDYGHAGQTAARKASVSFQGSETAMIIDGVAGAQNHRWG